MQMHYWKCCVANGFLFSHASHYLLSLDIYSPLFKIDAWIIYNELFKMFACSVATNTIQITLQMQIENPETSLTPPTPSSPGRDAQSPEGIASLSSGSSDNALGKYN